MSFRISNTPLINGKFVIGVSGLGVIGSLIPNTGEHGASVLWQHVTLPVDNNVLFYAVVTVPPQVGTLDFNLDGSFTYTAPLNTGDSFTYEWYRAGVSQGTDTVSLSVAATIAEVPQGVVTTGVISVGETTANIPFTYSDSDHTGFEYRVDGGSVITGASPINLTGLIASTTYQVEVRAINATGSGSWSAISDFTTSAEAVVPVAPQGVVTIGTIVESDSTATIPFVYSDSDQDSFEYQVDGGPVVSGSSPISLTGLTASTSYEIKVRAINSTGSGTWSAVTNFTTNDIDAVLTEAEFNVKYSFISQNSSYSVLGQDANKTEKINFYIRRNKPYTLPILADGEPHDLAVRGVTDVGVVIKGVEYKASDGFMSFGESSVTFILGSIPLPPKNSVIGALIIYDNDHPLGEPIFTDRTDYRLAFEFIQL